MVVKLLSTQRKVVFDRKQLLQASQLLLQYIGASDFDLGVKCTGDRTIRQLNRTYRKVDAPTDVLSFPFYEIKRPGVLPKRPKAEERDLGDIVLGMPYIQRQCVEADVPLDHRLLVVTHGVCHLIGYTHDTDRTEAKMQEKQAELLHRLQRDLDISQTLYPLGQ